MEEVNKDIIRAISDSIMPRHLTDKFEGCYIIIDGKVYIDGTGKFLFPTKQQAVRNFYNTFSWKVKREYYQICRRRNPRYSYGDTARSEIWAEFKKNILSRGFQVVQIK